MCIDILLHIPIESLQVSHMYHTIYAVTRKSDHVVEGARLLDRLIEHIPLSERFEKEAEIFSKEVSSGQASIENQTVDGDLSTLVNERMGIICSQDPASVGASFDLVIKELCLYHKNIFPKSDTEKTYHIAKDSENMKKDKHLWQKKMKWR